MDITLCKKSYSSGGWVYVGGGEVGGYGVDSASVALSVTVRGISKTSWRSLIHFSQMDSLTILKPSSNWSLFKLIISDQTLIKLKRFFAYICAF